MAKLLPLQSELRELIGQRPYTALSVARSSSKRQTDGGSRQTWMHTDRGRGLILDEVEPLIQSRLASIKSAFKALDRNGTGTVSKEEFRQVLKSLLSLNKNQLDKVRDGISLETAAFVLALASTS
ncbi:hypothetical protein Q5P01_003297 [Channa striata]|uniref:EF-hand domain-containing protein n=1 Tax=Channa striata TaxID=64152 RepID=A0AA88T931_CHASR|nr:hypothetical protein Q5P01_003297 [Channa striata]